MERLEKKLEKEKRKLQESEEKSQKVQKELDKFLVKQKKLEAICAEGVLGNKKAEK